MDNSTSELAAVSAAASVAELLRRFEPGKGHVSATEKAQPDDRQRGSGVDVDPTEMSPPGSGDEGHAAPAVDLPLELEPQVPPAKPAAAGKHALSVISQETAGPAVHTFGDSNHYLLDADLVWLERKFPDYFRIIGCQDQAFGVHYKLLVGNAQYILSYADSSAKGYVMRLLSAKGNVVTETGNGQSFIDNIIQIVGGKAEAAKECGQRNPRDCRRNTEIDWLPNSLQSLVLRLEGIQEVSGDDFRFKGYEYTYKPLTFKAETSINGRPAFITVKELGDNGVCVVNVSAASGQMTTTTTRVDGWANNVVNAISNIMRSNKNAQTIAANDDVGGPGAAAASTEAQAVIAKARAARAQVTQRAGSGRSLEAVRSVVVAGLKATWQTLRSAVFGGSRGASRPQDARRAQAFRSQPALAA